MKKTSYIAIIALLVLFTAIFARETNAQKGEILKRNVKIEGATPEKPVVYLGKVYNKKAGKFVDSYAIVHYTARSASKPIKTISGANCYGYLAKGAKWKTSEPWLVDSLHTGGLSAASILQNMSADVSKWEQAAGRNVDILGQGSIPADLIDSNNLFANGKNEVTFAPIDNQGAIAVTYVLGIFGGVTMQRELFEWDQIYDDTDFAWSMTGEAGKMDFESLATHELGHAVGMGDLYTSGCAEQTMYGYATEGETKKRTLETGDIKGINMLY